MQQRQASITKTVRVFMMSVIIVTMTVITTGWIVREFREFQQETQTKRQQYLESRQDLLKSQVDEAVAYIRYQHRLTEDRLRQSIRDRVEEAHSIAAHLYTQYHPTHDDAALQAMIKETLRPIRFNHGRGYYFATDLDGVEQLFADQPQLEGQNLLGMQDTRGQYVIQDMIALVKQSGAGFYEYTWTKPGSQGRDFRKIAFIKLFEPYQWLLGAGEYLDDVQADLQQETLPWLAAVRFEQEGYLFGSTYAADPLFTNGQMTVGSGNLWDLTDPYGVKIIQEQRKAVEQPEGGFVRYAWKKLTSDSPAPKMVFVKGVPEWQWIIGAGVYIDDIETIIAGQKTVLMRGIFRDILIMLMICAGLLGGSYGAARYLDRKLTRSFEAFSTFFETAATRLIPIAEDRVHFAEFERLAASANQMSAERRRMEAALRGHRDQLENLVKERTAELAAERTLLRVLIDHIPDLILIKDAANRFLAVNPALAHLMGANTPDELLGKTDFDFYPHEIAQQYYALEQELLTTGRPLMNQEELHRDPDTGENRWFLATKIPFRDQQGVIRGLVGISRDITEHKQLAEELRQHRDHLGELVKARTAELTVANARLQEEIAERQHAEEALRDSEEFLNNIVENIPTMMFVKDAATLRFVKFNKAGEALLGYSRAELLGKSDYDFFPKQEADFFVNHDRQVLAQRTLLDIPEETIQTRAHGERILHTKKIPILDKAGKPAYLLGISEDITDRKKVEDALNKRLLALTEPLDAGDISFSDLFNIEDIQKIQDAFAAATNVASIITYPDGVPITQPSNFCRLCIDVIRATDKGLTNCFASDASIGRHNPAGPIIQPCLSGGLWDAGASITVGGKHLANWLIGQVKNEAMNEEKLVQYARHIGADEEEFRQALQEVPVMSTEQFQKIATVLFLLSNELSLKAYQNIQQARFITDRKRAEEEIRTLNAELEQRVHERTMKLEATNKELQSFAYVVSHDLKAPLRAIAKLAQWLVEDYAGAFDVQGNAMVELLVGRVQRMDNLIDGVLEYSRIGRVVRQNETIALNRLVSDVLDSLAPPPTIDIEIMPELPTLFGDKTRVSQIFQNLIGNAIKFMDKPQGRIAVNCADDGAFWRFSVTDNGPGIDARHYDKIFQIFQTLHPRDEIESTGIGLAIVKKIVELYGGTIWVESAVGSGCTFWWTFPKHCMEESQETALC